MSIKIVLAVIVTIFWIWMIVDCIKRNFKNQAEKIIWGIIIILLTWIGALVYYFVIRISNPQGISRNPSKGKKRNK